MNKINSLTSIRFFAAAMIVIGHAGNAPGFEAFRFGASQLNNAVSFFYVLSGFILSFTYYNMDVKGGYLRFLIARLARIWPLHAAMLLVCFFVFGPNIFQEYGKSYTDVFFVNSFLLQSWIPVQKFYFSYNAVSWSVSTELFFYIAFPALLAILKRYGNAALLICISFPIVVAMLCAAISMPLHSIDGTIDGYYLVYINPIARIAEFAFGMYIFSIKKQLGKSQGDSGRFTGIELMSVIIVFLSLCAFSSIYDTLAGSPFEILFYWLSVAGSFPAIGFLIFIFSYQNGILSNLLSNKFFVYLGEISFSVYMCHQVILNYLRIFHGDILKENPTTMYVIYWLATILISAMLFHFVEVPARKAIRGMFSRRQVTA